jgi:predicted nucleic-acid-binding protein
MIGLDTNVLARYYVDDRGGPAVERQRVAARRLVESGQPLMVAKTVVLELEWVLRGFYGFRPAEVLAVLRHLLALPQVTLEDRPAVERAIEQLDAGFDLADALHHASYQACEAMVSFDDRRFARRARKLGLSPTVVVPSA